MRKIIGKFLFETVHGWKLVGDPTPPEVHRCVFVFAPHTSNWDLYFGVLCMMSLGVPIKFAIKNFWTRFPFGLLIKPLGGVGIDRSNKNGKRQVDKMADFFKNHKNIAFVITPEGSRSRRTRWKTGFYHIAKTADVPMVSFAANFAVREVWFGPVHTSEDSLETVMKSFTRFFKKSVAKDPDNFSPDERYL